MSWFPYLCIITVVLNISSSVVNAQEQRDHQREVISAHGQAGWVWLPEVQLTAEDLALEGEPLLSALEPQLLTQLRYVMGNLHGIESGAAMQRRVW